jgi:flavin reductase (DIM6/NTAB) family NADH-FMN oxidoreductase RutF
MKIDIPLEPPADLGFPEYIGWFLSNILIPYPLYIITTVDEAGIPNAQPNTWGLPFGDRAGQFFVFHDTSDHHTLQNVLATREFVVNLPSEECIPQVMKTVEHYPRGVDEVTASGLTAIPSTMVKAPRVAECKAHFECQVCWCKESHSCGADTVAMLVLGRIVAASADADVLGGTSSEKMARLRSAYVVSRNVDLLQMKITSPLAFGTIDRLKDFVKLEKERVVEYL